MKKHYILFIIVCIFCILISIIDIVYTLYSILIRIKEMVFILSLFLAAVIDFRINKKREFKHYLFLIVSLLAFMLTLYRAIVMII